MRGPYERLKYEFRRTFECPVCNAQLRAGGQTTTLLCPCQASAPPLEAKWMRFVGEGDSLRPWRAATSNVKPAPGDETATEEAPAQER